MITLNAVRVRCRAVYALTLLGKVPAIAGTRYRKSARLDVEGLLQVASPFDGVAYRVPLETRARLLMVRRPLEPAADLGAVLDYVIAIIADEPLPRLEELVLRTDSIELLRCFRRWAPGCGRTQLRHAIYTLEVMTS